VQLLNASAYRRDRRSRDSKLLTSLMCDDICAGSVFPVRKVYCLCKSSGNGGSSVAASSADISISNILHGDRVE